MNGLQQVIGARDIKSMHSVGARSIPKVQRSVYLELYMHRREKNRLKKEIFALDKRRNAAQRLSDAISKRIKKLQTETHEESKAKPYKNVPTKSLKTLPMQY